MKGKITSFCRKHGYGFIDGNIFFHIREWNYDHKPHTGSVVDYEAVDTSKGLRAVWVGKEK